MLEANQPSPPFVKLPEMQRLICEFANREMKAGRMGLSCSAAKMIGDVEHYFLVLDRRTTYADLGITMKVMVNLAEGKEVSGQRPVASDQKTLTTSHQPLATIKAWCLVC